MCSGQWGAVDRVFSMRFSLPSKTDDSVAPGSSRRSNGRAALLWIDACSGEFQQRAAWEGVARGLQRFPLTLRTIAVWGAKEVDDLFVSTLGAWMSEPERI